MDNTAHVRSAAEHVQAHTGKAATRAMNAVTEPCVDAVRNAARAGNAAEHPLAHTVGKATRGRDTAAELEEPMVDNAAHATHCSGNACLARDWQRST